MVQEYASRGDLAGVHHRLRNSLSERQVQGLVVRPLLRGLAYLHSKGICHRDIKVRVCVWVDACMHARRSCMGISAPLPNAVSHDIWPALPSCTSSACPAAIELFPRLPMHACLRPQPENILFTEDWTLKLADFGVSIDLTAERAVTRSGTEVYMVRRQEAGRGVGGGAEGHRVLCSAADSLRSCLPFQTAVPDACVRVCPPHLTSGAGGRALPA